ncbi:MAG: hypothetical protein AAFV95_27690 [Bacteroidota bacterium]
MAAKKKTKQSKPKGSTPPQAPKPSQDQQPSGLSFEAGFWPKNWLPALLLVLLAFGLYAASLGFDYVLDDKIVFTENNHVKKGLGGIWDILTTESFSGYFGEQRDLVEGGRYRPLSLVTFAMEFAFWGLNPTASHFINILLYALTGLLIFRLFHIIRPSGQPKTTWWIGLPFVGAALFLCHPIHSEVVANVKGRDEIMCLLGSLLALYYAFKYRQSGNSLWLVLVGVTYFLGILAKESALTFAAVIPLALYCFSRTDWSRLAWVTGTLLVCSLLYLNLRSNVIGYLLSSGTEVTDIMNNPFAGMSTGERLATVFYTLGLYLKLLFVPHPLTHDYYPYHIPIMNWGEWKSILSLIANVGIGTWGLWEIRKKSILGFGILFYFLTLSIVSNIPFSVGTFMNERFIYMPSLGFCLIAGWWIGRQLPKWTQKEGETYNFLSIGLFAILLLAYGGKTISRVPAWKNALSLNSAAIKVSKNSARANLFMGTALFKEYLAEKVDGKRKYELLDQVDQYVQKAMQINPRYGSAIKMYSGVAAEQYKKDRDIDKLLAQFKQLILTKPNIDYIDTYLEYLINQNESPDKLTTWCYEVGSRFAASGSTFTPNALKYLEKYGLQLTPNDPRIRQQLAQIYQSLGNAEKANFYRSN